MSDSPKDLQHYLDNPDDLPSDPAAIDALLGLGDTLGEPETDGEGEVEDEGSEAKQADESATAGASDEAETEQPDQGSTEDEGPIQSKDGKHTIPYAVLATERERRQAAERMTRELQDRISALEARTTAAATGQAAPTQTAESPTDDLSDEDLAELTRDFPAVAKLIDYTKKLEGRVGQFEDRFRTIEQQEADRAEQTAAQERGAIRAAVDANPTLRYWEQHDPERWTAAVEADRRLQGLPVNQGLSLDERLAKTVTIVETIYGSTALPAEYQAAAPVSTSQKTTQSTAELAEKAQAAVEKAGTFKPRTLSDMPGGAAPTTDPLEDLASLSASNLGAQMANMSQAQISSLLARLG